LEAEDEGGGVAVFDVAAAVLDGLLAGVDAGGEAGAAGAVAGACSAVLGAASFFSPVLGAGASLPADGFILSE
jgi:hypothetical protein